MTTDAEKGVEIIQEPPHQEMGQNILAVKDQVEGARAATELEHQMPFWQAIKTHRKAVFWSIVVSTTIAMEGYDTTLIGSFFAYPAFQRKYGQYYGPKIGYQLSGPWQTALNDIGAAGNIIGALANGYFTGRYGHRKVMMFNLVLMTGFVFITFFAPNIHVLVAGAFLCAIPWGAFATQGPAYAAEVCPVILRGHLTAYVNLCWCIGQLLSAAVLKALVNNPTQWSYRIPFAVQWVWPVPLFLLAIFCPESPWFLVRVGRLPRAERSLARLSSKTATSEVEHKHMVALMVQTTEYERQCELGSSYWDCFKGSNLVRTEIACIAFLSQVTDGGALVYSPTYFFTQAGISATTAYAISLGGTSIGFVGTCISWLIIPRAGRRTMFLVGFCILVTCLYLIAILGCVPKSKGVEYTQAALALIWLGSYSMTVGPIVYTIVSEVGATQVRTKTVVLGRSTYYVGNLIGGVLEPYMINPTQWNLSGKTAFFWGTLSLLTTIWGFFRLPETKGRTYEELDIMFAKKVPLRKFKEFVVDDEMREDA